MLGLILFGCFYLTLLSVSVSPLQHRVRKQIRLEGYVIWRDPRDAEAVEQIRWEHVLREVVRRGPSEHLSSIGVHVRHEHRHVRPRQRVEGARPFGQHPSDFHMVLLAFRLLLGLQRIAVIHPCSIDPVPRMLHPLWVREFASPIAEEYRKGVREGFPA